MAPQTQSPPLPRTPAPDSDCMPGLVEQHYDTLRAIAYKMLLGEDPGHTLQPTALVHEVFLKITSAEYVNDTAHFMALAATGMRRVLVNHAKQRNAIKRGGPTRTQSLTHPPEDPALPMIDVLAVNDALEALGELDETLHSVIEMRVFGALSHKEISTALGISERTSRRHWNFGRAWLKSQIA